MSVVVQISSEPTARAFYPGNDQTVLCDTCGFPVAVTREIIEGDHGAYCSRRCYSYDERLHQLPPVIALLNGLFVVGFSVGCIFGVYWLLKTIFHHL